MRLKVKERTQKYWAMVSDLLCRTLITQECCTILKGNRPLPMKCRTRLYIAGVVLGLVLLRLLYAPFLYLLPEELQNHSFFPSAFAVFILTFPSVTINWFIKNRDMSRQLGDSSQQLKDSSKQLDYSLQQQNETLFSNSLQLLFKENDITVRSIGLKELVKLKKERRIDSERIDFITSSGLQIKKARLQGADLQGAKLQEADLEGANLQWANLEKADLRGVNLREVNLQGANLQEANLQEADIQKERLREARNKLLSIQRLKLSGGNLQEKDIQKANLREEDLYGVDLQGAKLQGAILEGANLQWANLKKANLQGANLKKAKLERSLYDEETIFPNGFDLSQHGMIKLGVDVYHYPSQR